MRPSSLPTAEVSRDRLRSYLTTLYGAGEGARAYATLAARLERFLAARPPPAQLSGRLDELGPADAMVITYGDQVQAPGEAPLATLEAFFARHLGDAVNRVHVLPFYPYSSDDGFSVIDYYAVDPALGTWDDVARLSRRFKLMFDGVVNHISAKSAWFKAFLDGDPKYRDWFIVHDEPVDVKGITRPRTHPVLTEFETRTGAHKVWTTFSTDQIDLNVKNPEVLLELVEVLLDYVEKGASCIRLDAIGYLWKELGTRCIHLPQTHAAVKLFRSVMDLVAPQVILITETNVPHLDNISYFGDGHDEAQLVYQFPLAPLTLNAFHAQSAKHLRSWAGSFGAPSSDTTFFNFLASHDGIGVMPASGILSPAELDGLVQTTLKHGGRVNYKANADGSTSPYELNITLFDALSDPAAGREAEAVERFVTANAIMLAMAGVPGIYVHSLFGSSNDHAGVERTGHNRTINRKKWQLPEIEARLANPESRERRVLERFKGLLRARASSPAFHPNGFQTIAASPDAVFAFVRSATDRSEHVLCAHNLSTASQTLSIDLAGKAAGVLEELVTGRQVRLDAQGRGQLELPPLGFVWLRGRPG